MIFSLFVQNLIAHLHTHKVELGNEIMLCAYFTSTLTSDRDRQRRRQKQRNKSRDRRRQTDRQTDRDRPCGVVSEHLLFSTLQELALLRQIKRTASVIVRENVELLVVDKDVFVKTCPRIYDKELITKMKFCK